MSFRFEIVAAALAFACAVPVCADEIRMEDGSVFKGTVLGIEGGTLSFEPKSKVGVSVFKIKLDEVAYLSTDGPIYLSTGDAPPAYVRVRGEPKNLLKIVGDDSRGTPLGAVADAWVKPDDDPKVKEAKRTARKWNAEVYTELVGKRGNADVLGSSGGITVQNFGLKDRLKLFAK